MGAKKLGRPTDNPKNIELRIRLDEDTNVKLEFCSEAKNVSKAEIARLGIQKVYEEMKK